jgi:hypothetical protein
MQQQRRNRTLFRIHCGIARRRISRRPWIAAALLLAATSGEASTWKEAAGLFELMPQGGPNGSRPMKNLRLSAGGWLDAGITYNPSDPGDGFNGTATFGDRASELQLNQLYLYLERPVNVQGESWDVGGRVDFLFGADAVFTQAGGDPRGHWDRRLAGGSDRFYQAALPQAYMEVVAPLGKGIRLKAGHFYTIIGNESVMAPDNFFYSHTYLMQYGEPFTHTGVLAGYSPTDTLTLNAGAVTGSLNGGWDGVFDRSLNEWAFLGGMTWAGDGTAVSLSASHGGTGDAAAGDWNLYSIVAHHDLAESLHYTFQHDYGWAEKILDGKNAEWYGIAQYLDYDVRDDLAVGVRGEWFRDDDGFRVLSRARIAVHPAAGGRSGMAAIGSVDAMGNPAGNGYFAITAGLNWKPAPWAIVRPNVRYDWTDKANMFDCSGNPAPATCSRSSQWLLSMDVVLMF